MVYWIIWLVVCAAFIAAYSIGVLPVLFGFVAGALWVPTDRGVKKYYLSNGIAILYEPNLVAAKYIKQYKIYQRTQDDYIPTFIGEWAEPFQSVEYDIYVFNKHNRRICKKRIRECPCGVQFTHSVSLPPETEFVSLSVRCVDGKKIEQTRCRRSLFYTLFTLFAFIFSVVIDVSAGVFVIVTFLSRALGGFITDAFSISATQWLLFLVLPALLLALAITLVAVCCIFLKGVFKINAKKY